MWPNSGVTLVTKPLRPNMYPIQGPLVWPGSGTTLVAKFRGHFCDKTLRALMWPTLKPLVRPDTGATLVAKLGKVPLAANLEGRTYGQIMRSHCDQTCHFVCHSYGQTLAPLLRPTCEVTLAISAQTPLHTQIRGHSTLAPLLRPNSRATLCGQTPRSPLWSKC